MTQLTKQIAMLERIDQLIRLKATGRPKHLAERLGVSEATVFRIIETMKILNAPVNYDLTRQSYVYTEKNKFRFGFYVEELDSRTERILTGGSSFGNLRNLINF